MRLWILLLALLLLAAPADQRSAEVTDSHAAALADDVELAVVELAVPEHEPVLSGIAIELTEIVMPAPVRAGVFRPPRRAAG